MFSQFSRYNTETVTEKLDRLVLMGIIHVTDRGFAVWCYHCKMLRSLPPVANWDVDTVFDFINDHEADHYDAERGEKS